MNDMKPAVLILAFSVLTLTENACEKMPQEPSSIMVEIQDIETTASEAVISGTIEVSGKCRTTMYVMVVYGTSPDELTGKSIARLEGNSSFEATLDTLEEGTRYYCRALVLSNLRPIRGEILAFETLKNANEKTSAII